MKRSLARRPTLARLDFTSDLRLRGRSLAAARIAWIMAALLILLLDLLGTPVLFHQMQVGCTGDQCINLQLDPGRMSTLLAAGLSHTFVATYLSALYWTGTLIYALIAALIFWRRSDDRMALFGSFTLLVFGAGPVFGPVKALPTSNPNWMPVNYVVELAGTVSFYVFFCIFPSGHFIPRWMRWAAIAWAADELLAPFPSAALQALLSSAFALFWSLLVFAQVYRYWRVSSPVQRQQTKWVVLGIAAGLGGFLVVLSLVQLVLGSDWRSSPAGILLVSAGLSAPLWLIPIFIAIAILRSRLWDIDVLIRRTLIYGTLTAILAGVYFAVVVSAQALSVRLTGQTQPPAWLIVVTTLLIAALFTPLRRRVQGVIDRRFYRSRYNAARTVEAFAATLRTELELAELREHLVGVVDDAMRPAHVSLWLRLDPVSPDDTH